MLYEITYNNNAVRVLETKALTAVDCIQALSKEGYIPNKNKYVILNLCSILIHAYKNLDIYTEEQHKRLDTLANKVLAL